MQETPKPTKKALQQRIKEAQKALKAAEESELYPALRKKCKYCHLVFTTAATRNGQKQEFCKPTHRWAFAREGKKPIDVILKRQEKRMRQIAREEIETAFAELAAVAERLGSKPEVRTEQHPTVKPASQQSA